MIKPNEETLTSWLYRPYIDLTPSAPAGNIWTKGLILAIQAFENNVDGIRLHGVRPEPDRKQIIREAYLPQFQVYDPADLPLDLRTTQWNKLVKTLRRHPREPDQFNRALWVLSRMCLHDAILLYSVPHYPEQMEAGPYFCEQMLIRGMSKTTYSADPDTSDLEWVVTNAERGSWAAIEATYLLAAVSAKGKNTNLDTLRYWVDKHDQQISSADANPHDFSKWRSRYHRVKAFIPQLEGDKAGMTSELDWASEYATAMLSDTIEAKTLKIALAETRTKEALFLGDLELAERRAASYIELAPLDPQAYLTHGNVLAEMKCYSGAIVAYTTAVRYGPPKTEVANFMIGQCWEQLEDNYKARDAYIAALNSDPQGYTSLEQLIIVSEKLGDTILTEWSKARLTELELKEVIQEEPKPYQRYEGALGR